jgi:hypothetical protein
VPGAECFEGGTTPPQDDLVRRTQSLARRTRHALGTSGYRATATQRGRPIQGVLERRARYEVRGAENFGLRTSCLW